MKAGNGLPNDVIVIARIRNYYKLGHDLLYTCFLSPEMPLNNAGAVADAGFLEGGFWYIIARKARARKFGSHAHFRLKLRLFSIALERNLLPYPSIDLFSI